MYSVISVIVHSLEGNTKKSGIDRSWTERGIGGPHRILCYLLQCVAVVFRDPDHTRSTPNNITREPASIGVSIKTWLIQMEWTDQT